MRQLNLTYRLATAFIRSSGQQGGFARWYPPASGLRAQYAKNRGGLNFTPVIHLSQGAGEAHYRGSQEFPSLA